MDWILITSTWYLTLLIIGLVFTPLTKKVFKSFGFDLGYPFAKALGIILLSYFVYVLGIVKILPFSRLSLIFALCLFALINFFIHKINKSGDNQQPATNNRLPAYLIEECIFIFCLFFWTFVRSQEPSIHGLEKFMDFGFINSILKTKFFPPKDIWYTNLPINYYYFGHLTGALLIKLSNVKASIGYNLILATIFALGVTQVFSLVANIIKRYDQKISQLKIVIYGVIGAYLINLGANLHTIYLFTKGYPNETPIPFWKILSGFNPTAYWYPNATRFIPYTIHEFPSYSYVVADLHGHVFDIPFVLLTLGILFIIFTAPKENKDFKVGQNQKLNIKDQKDISKLKNKGLFSTISNYFQSFGFNQNKPLSDHFKQIITNLDPSPLLKVNRFQLIPTIFLGFMAAIHYMTNAFDGPIYILLTLVIFLFLYGFSFKLLVNAVVLLVSFVLFSLPFSWYFKPFVNGIGVNCSPKFLTNIGKIGPFLFEAGNCQISPFWMLFVLWGFFWISFLLFLFIRYRISRGLPPQKNNKMAKLVLAKVSTDKQLNNFLLILFSFGIFLTIIPEFFYIKDIYPQHFRANTMFKLGYQAFSMMGIASIVTFYLLKNIKKTILYYVLSVIYIIFLFFPSIYPFFSIPSYYGPLNRKVQLDGQLWLKDSYPEDNEIIDFLNKNEKGQPVILEAQGDSYTDYERISAFTGLPTVAGWWVHEWLWRGSADIVGNRIPDVVALYESNDIEKTKSLINKYQIKYVIISRLERQKYPKLNEEKWLKIGRLILRSSNGLGALYQVNH
jgi:uncharacterized membrane protein